jgi:hypothetical protein
MLLSFHIFGAALLGVLVLLSIFAIHQKSKHLHQLRLGVIILGVSQIASGVLLVVNSPEVPVARICVASTLYLAALFAVEAALRKAIRVGSVKTSVRK